MTKIQWAFEMAQSDIDQDSVLYWYLHLTSSTKKIIREAFSGRTCIKTQLYDELRDAYMEQRFWFWYGEKGSII